MTILCLIRKPTHSTLVYNTRQVTCCHYILSTCCDNNRQIQLKANWVGGKSSRNSQQSWVYFPAINSQQYVNFWQDSLCRDPSPYTCLGITWPEPQKKSEIAFWYCIQVINFEYARRNLITKRRPMC